MNPATASGTDAFMPWFRAKQRLRQWWLDRHPPLQRVALHQRNLYILPTRAGWMLCLTLLVLLLASINYQLNLGYLLSFLIAGCAAASTWICHRNMLGLQLQIMPTPAVFAGCAASIPLQIHNASLRWRYALAVTTSDFASSPEVMIDAAPRGAIAAQLLHTPTRRGLCPVPVLQMQTLYPLGLFRVWTVWRPAASMLVYPAPEIKPPPLPEPVASRGSSTLMRRSTSGTDFDGVRPYRRGDPLKWVAWKKVSASGDLVSREQQSFKDALLWLDLHEVRTGSLETDLQRLCAWVLRAESEGQVYGLRLKQLEISPSCGPDHRNRCLEALALC